MAALKRSRSSAVAMAVGAGADHLHAEALKGSPLVEGHGQVEGGLAAEGRQHRVRALARR